MNKKFLFIFALAVFLLIPLSSAGLFQSNKVFDKTHRLDLYQKQFLKEQKIEKFKEYGRYEIHDSKFLGLLRGDLTQDFVLLSSDNSIINAYAILEVTNYRPETLLDTLKFKGGTPRDIKYSYYVTENKQVKVQDYKQVCYKPKLSLTRFKTNSTNSTNTKTCKQVKNGFHYKTETNSYWKTYNGQVMPKGKYKLKIDGKLESVNKKTDWILNKGNYDLDKWAWWNNSWSKKREISGLTGDLSYLSTITYDADMNANFSDLRFADNATENIELNHTIESYTASTSAIVRIYNKGESSVMMYYGNAGATTTSSASDVHFNPVSYYYLDESSGTTATDSVGTNDGTNVNGVLVNQAGKIGTAYDFDGVDDYVNMGTSFNTILSSSSFTASLWINSDVLLQNPEYLSFIWNSVTEGWRIYYYNGILYFSTINNGEAWINSGYTTTLSASTWYYLTATYDETTKSMTLYLNGSSVATATRTTSMNAIDGNFNIGTNELNNGQWFNGKIDEVAIYNRAITSTEVSKLYNYTSPSFITGTEQNNNQLTINQNSPIDTFNSSSSTVAFDCNATDETGVLSLNLTINDTVYQTVTGNGSTNLTLTSNEVLSDGYYNWYCTTNDDTTTLNTSTRTLTVDTTPFIEFISPTPANNTQLATSVIPVYVNISTPYFSNVTYYLHNEDTGANFTQFYNTQIENYNWTGLSTGHYDFYVQINTTTGQSNQTELRHTEHDIDAPNISVTSPVSEDFIVNGDTLNLNWTTSDLNQDTCWYNYNSLNTTVTCSANTTTLNYVAGQNTLTFYANDTFGNENNNITNWEYNVIEKEITYNNQTIEGSIENFSINIFVKSGLLMSQAIFNYNGINYTASFTNSGENYTVSNINFLIQDVENDTNSTFSYILSFNDGNSYQTTENIQFINSIDIDDCSTLTYEIFTAKLFDEEDFSNLTGKIETIIEISPLNDGIIVKKFIGEYNSVQTKTFCSDINLTSSGLILDSILRYSASGYTPEFYNIQKADLSNYPKNINLYDLSINKTTEFKIIYQGSDLVPVPGAIIQLTRQSFTDGEYSIVEAPLTSASSTALVHVNVEANKYIINVVKDGEVLGIFDNLIFKCQSEISGQCDLDLISTVIPTNLVNIETTRDFGYSLSSANNTITTTYSIPSGTPKTVNVQLLQKKITGSSTVCNTTIISAGGSIDCTYDSSIDESTLELKIYSEDILQAEKGYIIKDDLSTTFGKNNYFIVLILMLSLIGMTITSPEWIIIISILGLMLSGGIWLINGVDLVTGLGAIGFLIVAGIILIIKISKQDDQ